MKKIQATCAIIINNDNQLLLIKRRREPFANHWSLVSGIGFTRQGLSPEMAVVGEVKSDINSSFYGSEIFRMPIDHDNYICEIAVFLGSIEEQQIEYNPIDVADCRWFSVNEIRELGKLAYEHNEIIERCVKENIF